MESELKQQLGNLATAATAEREPSQSGAAVATPAKPGTNTREAEHSDQPAAKRRRWAVSRPADVDTDSDFESSADPTTDKTSCIALFDELSADVQEANSSHQSALSKWQAQLSALDKSSIERDVEARASLAAMEERVKALQVSSTELLAKKCERFFF